MRHIILSIIACLALTACATSNPMGVKAGDSSIDTSQKSLLLMTMTVSHLNSTIRVPKLVVVYVETPHPQNKADHQNYVVDDEGTTVQDGTSTATTYELRMAIAPGKYTIVSASGLIRVFPFIGNFRVPLELDVNVQPNSVTYLGHIDAVMRPYTVADGFDAGPVIPLVDQAATGISTGTFDVSVTDKSKTDIPDFRANFPALQNANIQTEILGPYDRPRAIAWSQSGL